MGRINLRKHADSMYALPNLLQRKGLLLTGFDNTCGTIDVSRSIGPFKKGMSEIGK